MAWVGLAAAVILLFSSSPTFAFEEDLVVRQGSTPQARLILAEPLLLSQNEEAPGPGPGPAIRMRDHFVDTFPRHLLQGAQKSFFGRNLAILAIAGVATGALLASDNDIRDYFQDERPIGRTARTVGDWLGQGATLFGLAGVTYGVGEALDHRGLAKSGEIFIEGLSITGVATAILKVTTQRERPNNSNTLSFPSAHASGLSPFPPCWTVGLATRQGFRPTWPPVSLPFPVSRRTNTFFRTPSLAPPLGPLWDTPWRGFTGVRETAGSSSSPLWVPRRWVSK